MTASMASTRVVGPWPTKAVRDNVRNGLSKQARDRSRPFTYAGGFWLELWPAGYSMGDSRVHRAPLPALAALPRLLYQATPNVSDRGGSAIDGIIIHETEGGYSGAVSWLQNTKAQASAHIVVNEIGSEATQLVPWEMKAWHAENANHNTIGIELAGFTSAPNAASQLRNVSRIVAVLCGMYGIPVRVADNEGHGGITTHRALGAYGGGHHDPGGFDFDTFIAMVLHQKHSMNLPSTYGRKR